MLFFPVKRERWKGAWECLEVDDHGKETQNLSWVRTTVIRDRKEVVAQRKKWQVKRLKAPEDGRVCQNIASTKLVMSWKDRR